MITKKQTAMVMLAVCSLALTALGDVHPLVTRPLTIKGNITVTINLLNGTWTYEESGVSAHWGLFTSTGSGFVSPTLDLVGSGAATAANGDEITWITPGPTWYVEWTGGTGRFAKCSGGFDTESSSPWVVTFPNPTTMMMTLSYIGVGTITY